MLCYKKIGTGFAEKENLIWKIKLEVEKLELTSFSVQAPTVWNVLSHRSYMRGSFSLFRS